jgi:hypothetical protein
LPEVSHLVDVAAISRPLINPQTRNKRNDRRW